jgi:hypothetical protein
VAPAITRASEPSERQRGAGESGSSANADSQHGGALGSKTRTRKARRMSLRARAAQRLSELYRLALFRRQHGHIVDADMFAFLLAATLACGHSGRFHIAGRQRTAVWHGLDHLSLREAIKRADLGHLNDDELAAKIKAVQAWNAERGPRLITARRLGEILQLRAFERTACKIRTADAVDEPRAVREKRVAEGRRERDKMSKRAKRAGKHRPRSEYLAEAEGRRQLCEQHGITERTLRRWVSAGKVDVRSVSAVDISCKHRATDFGRRRPMPAATALGEPGLQNMPSSPDWPPSRAARPSAQHVLA